MTGAERRWTLHCYSHIHLSGATLKRGEVIAVMPVSEHEAALAAARLGADLAALREAAQAVVDIWHKPTTIDSATDLDSAIDELGISLR